MAEEPIHAYVNETGESAYAVDVTVSGHNFKGDEPVSFGGGNFGPAPYDLLLAALGECTAMTVRWYAKQKNWPLDKVEVKLSHSKIEAGDASEAAGRSGKVDIFDKEVTLHGDTLTPEQRTKLVEVAAKCPVHRTLQSNPIIRTIM